MNVPSLLRLEEHAALSAVTLSGSVLDLGGDRNSEYVRFFKGRFETTIVNFDKKTHPDILHDLEKPLPIPDVSFDHVLMFNVLEHIFEYRALIAEAVRVLKREGSAVIVVPFLFPAHPSPHDYHRFTAECLQRELERVGLTDIRLRTLGGGVFTARYLMLDRLLPRPLRIINFYTGRYVAVGLDFVFASMASALGKKYSLADYALGYCITAKKI
jgi:SAM-dependent methyltransferase